MIRGSTIATIAAEASRLVMQYYGTNIEITRKIDSSLVTEVDIKSSDLIIQRLQAIDPGVPIISEEAGDTKTNLDILNGSDKFWLIDPIDGTWGFVNKCGDFAINIALVERGHPTLGAIAAPLRDAVYYNEDSQVYRVIDNKRKRLKFKMNIHAGLDFLVSDGNLSQRTQDFINLYPVKTITPIPSAYKYALMVEGHGQIYPRFKPTFVWDTAAGHAILKGFGGDVLRLDGTPLKYRGHLINPDCIALASTNIPLLR